MKPKTKIKRGRTIILKKTRPNVVQWIRWLEETALKTEGPHPDVCKTRNEIWGKESLIVRAGAYIYLIKEKDDGCKLPWESKETG